MLTLLLLLAAAGSDWMPLFDGRTLNGWIWSTEKNPPEPSWAATGGMLCTTPGHGTEVYLISRDSYADFELEFEWKGDTASNSGVKYRFQGYWVDGALRTVPSGPHRIEPVGLEYQITDDQANRDALSTPRHSAGALYEYWPPRKSAPAKAGVWHKARIIARGLHIEHYLDGEKVVDVMLDSPEMQAAFQSSSRKGSSAAHAKHARSDSPIALQIHDGVACFRNLRIRRL